MNTKDTMVRESIDENEKKNRMLENSTNTNKNVKLIVESNAEPNGEFNTELSIESYVESKKGDILNGVNHTSYPNGSKESPNATSEETNHLHVKNAQNSKSENGNEKAILKETENSVSLNGSTGNGKINDDSNFEKNDKQWESNEKEKYISSVNLKRTDTEAHSDSTHTIDAQNFSKVDDMNNYKEKLESEEKECIKRKDSKDEIDQMTTNTESHVADGLMNGISKEETNNVVIKEFEKKNNEVDKDDGIEDGSVKRRKLSDGQEEKTEKQTEENECKGQYLQEKLEQLLRETKRYTEKLVGQKIRSSESSKVGKGRRTLLTEKEEDDMLIKEANENDDTIILKQPSKIRGVMKYYQIEGLNWLYQLFRFRINGILADEMGLGKTLQTISLLSYLRFERNIKRKSIIICPRSTLDNWHEEILKWCPELIAIKYYGDKEQRKEINKYQLHEDFDVLLTTYEIVIKEKGALYEIDWFYLVIDEAHRIKNEKSVLSTSVRFLKSENRLLLTGTPLHNSLKELWSLLNFLMPRIFDNSEEFDNLFNISKINTNDNKQNEIIMQLHSILKPFMLRRLKVEVEQSLLPKREIYVFVGMSKLQKKLYSDILSKNIDVLNAMTGSKNQMLNILMQLRKCCNHPYLFDGIEEPPYIEGNHLIETSGKMSLLDKLLPRLKKENSRVLLFSQMTRLLDIIDDYCRWKNYPYLRIDGATPGDERQIRINQFNEPNSKYFIFLLSTRAGGIGINLTTANIVILFDSDYNPQMDIQAMDRAHRIGQKKKVIVYRFVTQNSVEEKIVERAAKKLKLDSLIIQKGKLNLSSVNKENNKSELHEIIHFGAPEVYKTQDFSSISDEDIDIILANAEKRTKEIENKLSNLEKTFDLTNISLDGGLNMYNRGLNGEMEEEESSDDSDDEENDDDEDEEDDEGGDGECGENDKSGVKKKKKNIHKIRKTIKKFLKSNKKSIPFLDLGERKSKWKLARTERNIRTHQRKTLQGWRAEVKGGHDFQFFDIQRLDELDKILEKYEIYAKNEKKIEDILSSQKELSNFKKVPSVSEFLDSHAKNLYKILKLICPKIAGETEKEKEKEKEKEADENEVDRRGNSEKVENEKKVNKEELEEEHDMAYYKDKLKSLIEKRKKRVNYLRFHEKNVEKCYMEAINFFKKHIFPLFSKTNTMKNTSKSKGGKDKKFGNSYNNENRHIDEEDMSKIDIEQIKKEREELMSEGFVNWNRAEYNKLISGLILYGSDNIEEVYNYCFANTRKTLEEVRSYVEAFFVKYDRVKGGMRTLERIRKSDLQRKIVQEENDMITDFVEKQLAKGINQVDQLQLPNNLNYEDMDPLSVNIPMKAKSENVQVSRRGPKEEKNDVDEGKEKNDGQKEIMKEETEEQKISEEVKAVLDRENKIFLWLLYEQGVMQIKNIHCLVPYYWPNTLNFFRFSMFTMENVQYRCRLIINAILCSQKQNVGMNSTKGRRKHKLKQSSR